METDPPGCVQEDDKKRQKISRKQNKIENIIWYFARAAKKVMHGKKQTQLINNKKCAHTGKSINNRSRNRLPQLKSGFGGYLQSLRPPLRAARTSSRRAAGGLGICVQQLICRMKRKSLFSRYGDERILNRLLVFRRAYRVCCFVKSQKNRSLKTFKFTDLSRID